MKSWIGFPNVNQRANNTRYATWMLAVEAKLRLQRILPGRVFRVEKLEDSSSEGSD